jgi:putative FmdB family regulatory protein
VHTISSAWAFTPGRPLEEFEVPTYAYACTECGHRFEEVQSFTDDALTECPECEGRLRKVFSNVGIVFKGSGFYRNDSRSDAKSNGAKGSDKGADKSADKGDKGADKSAAKSADKTGASSSSDSKSSGSGSSGSSPSTSSSSGKGAGSAA